MDVGPACQPRSPLAFPSGAWAKFPHVEWFPINNSYLEENNALQEL